MGEAHLRPHGAAVGAGSGRAGTVDRRSSPNQHRGVSTESPGRRALRPGRPMGAVSPAGGLGEHDQGPMTQLNHCGQEIAPARKGR
jgi:hypothetical protein